MEATDLNYENLVGVLLRDYEVRAKTDSARFMRWYLENVWRLDVQDADDACVDGQQDKGIDAIYVSDFEETVFLFQSKVRQSATSKLGDVELKNFFGSVEQFRTPQSIEAILDGAANDALKRAIIRWKVKEKVAAGYTVSGYFCTNQLGNADTFDYLSAVSGLILADADGIAKNFVETEKPAGVTGEFLFDSPDFEVINYSTGMCKRASF